jgi:polyhydroxybutyrate depolymerase
MKQKIAILILLFASLACRRSAETAPAILPVAVNESEIISSGEKRHFILHVPPSYSGEPTALIFNFHGYGSNSLEEERLSGMSDKADKAGFIVVYPDGNQATWYTGPIAQGDADRQFVRDLIAHISSLYNVDAKRIYATGMSNGGGMTNRVACNLTDLFAAIAPNSGAYNYWQDCSPSRPIPVLALHGLNDEVVPYEGGKSQEIVPAIETWAAAWAQRNGCNSAAVITMPVDTVTMHSWVHCDENAEVILYSLENHGHSWPGSPIMPALMTSQAINATDIMWDFFQAHPMP